jgi:hypothetical protein
MVISNGNLADANEVRPQILGAIKNLIGFDKNATYYYRTPFISNYYIDGFYDTSKVSSSTNWTNAGTEYWTSTNSAELISKTSTFPSTITYATAYVDYSIYETYDEFSGASIDTSLWNTAVTNNGTITESAGNAVLDTPGSLAGDTALLYSKNVNLTSTVNYLWFKTVFDGITSHAGDSSIGYSIYLALANSATPVFTIYTKDSDSVFDETYYWELIYNADANLIDVFRNGIWYKNIDTSGTPTALAIQFYCHASYTAPYGASCKLYIDYCRKLKLSPSSTLTTYVSADNGSHYTTATREYETTIGTTGTQFKLKNTATISGSEYLKIRGYGVFVR